MVIVTGALGFIGSCLVSKLNALQGVYVIAVDDFNQSIKEKNLKGKHILEYVQRDVFIDWFRKNTRDVDAVLHMGARTDTTEKDKAIFDTLNLNYSKEIWKICTEAQIPLVYASSASVYGDGSLGFVEDHRLLPNLIALNPYAESKLEFDRWVIKQENSPPAWAGLRFFNVYGPNENHKGRMASVIWHAYHQILESGQIKLFRSHRNDYADGEQKRDFVYVKDVCRVCIHFLDQPYTNGFYNVGTGTARTFSDLAKALFSALNKKEQIEFTDTPESIRDSYQYFTQADLGNLRSANFSASFTTLEDGVNDYVNNYLDKNKYF